jgi:hypothetical protein
MGEFSNWRMWQPNSAGDGQMLNMLDRLYQHDSAEQGLIYGASSGNTIAMTELANRYGMGEQYIFNDRQGYGKFDLDISPLRMATGHK